MAVTPDPTERPEVCLELTRAEAEAIDEALAIMETEDRMPEHESAFNKVRTALSPRGLTPTTES